MLRTAKDSNALNVLDKAFLLIEGHPIGSEDFQYGFVGRSSEVRLTQIKREPVIISAFAA